MTPIALSPFDGGLTGFNTLSDILDLAFLSHPDGTIPTDRHVPLVILRNLGIIYPPKVLNRVLEKEFDMNERMVRPSEELAL